MNKYIGLLSLIVVSNGTFAAEEEFAIVGTTEGFEEIGPRSSLRPEDGAGGERERRQSQIRQVSQITPLALKENWEIGPDDRLSVKQFVARVEQMSEEEADEAIGDADIRVGWYVPGHELPRHVPRLELEPIGKETVTTYGPHTVLDIEGIRRYEIR